MITQHEFRMMGLPKTKSSRLRLKKDERSQSKQVGKRSSSAPSKHEVTLEGSSPPSGVTAKGIQAEATRDQHHAESPLTAKARRRQRSSGHQNTTKWTDKIVSHPSQLQNSTDQDANMPMDVHEKVNWTAQVKGWHLLKKTIYKDMLCAMMVGNDDSEAKETKESHHQPRKASQLQLESLGEHPENVEGRGDDHQGERGGAACPICGMNLGETSSNEQVNEHVDKCLSSSN